MTQSSQVYDFVLYAFNLLWLNALLILAVGACLCILSEEDQQGDIAASIWHLGVNYVDLTPLVTRLIDPSEVRLLQYLPLGGEEVLATDVTWWSALQEVVNGHGPAECTPKCAAYNYSLGASKWASNIG
jgi:hypothetical protein